MSRSYRIKRLTRSLLILSSILILMMGFQNCATVDLNSNPELRSSSVDLRESLLFNQKIDKDNLNIDIIWVVDFAQPKSNNNNDILTEHIQKFIEKAEMRSNLNLALISNHDLNIKNLYRQINKNNKSYKVLDRVIAEAPKLIRDEVIRENSKKIIIFIGDKDISGEKIKSNSEFMEKLSVYMNLDEVKIYSIVGLDSDKDWGPHFQSILNNISRTTKNEFLLPSRPGSKMEVRVDGVISDHYSIEGTSLILNPSNFSEDKEYIVQVDYLKLSEF